MIERKCYVCGLIWQVSIQQIHKPKKNIFVPTVLIRKTKRDIRDYAKKLNEVI